MLMGERVDPKYMGVSKNRGFLPQIIHLFIGFSIIFTIHFGIPLFLVQHPYTTNLEAVFWLQLRVRGPKSKVQRYRKVSWVRAIVAKLTDPKKNMSQNWKYSPNRGENKKYLKPPPSSPNLGWIFFFNQMSETTTSKKRSQQQKSNSQHYTSQPSGELSSAFGNYTYHL